MTVNRATSITLVAVLAILFLIGATLIGLNSGPLAVAYTGMCCPLSIIIIKEGMRHDQFAHPLQLAVPLLLYELVIAPVSMVYLHSLFPEWLGNNVHAYEYLSDAMILTSLGLSAILLGNFVAESTMFQFTGSTQRYRIHESCTSRLGIIIALLLSASVIASILTLVLVYGGYNSENFTDKFNERRVLSAGTGYISLLASCGDIAVILLACETKTDMGWGGRAGLWVAALVAGVPYLLAGQRGGFIYCLLFIPLTRYSMPRAHHGMLTLLPCLCVPLVVMDLVSTECRAAVAEGRSPFVGMPEYDVLKVSRSFAHLELLGVVVELKESGADLPDTVISSLFNWLPRLLFAQKGLSTGPTLAVMLAPEWVNKEGLHTSSYTTGPFVECYYNGGVILLVLGSFVFGFAVGTLANWHRNRVGSVIDTCVFVYEAYLLCWDIWVDDFGGLAVKQFMFLCILVGIWIVMPKRR